MSNTCRKEETYEVLANKKQKTIGIVQINRTGDIVQCLQVVKELKAENPSVRIVLIARKQFAAPIIFLIEQVFDNYILLDFKEMTANGLALKEVLGGLDLFLDSINQEDISVLVNLSFSKTSSYLCSLIESTHKLGTKYNKHGQVTIQDDWSQFVYSNVMGGSLNPFSLNDIFRFILGVQGKEKREVRKAANINHIVIHPFASHSKKRWKENKWTEIIYKLLKDNSKLEITIVGSKAEEHFAAQITRNILLNKYSSRVHSKVGKTNIEELFTTLKKASLFLGHDSMVGHLASLANIPSLTISLGCVRPHETTPEGSGNYNVVPKSKCFPCFPVDRCDFYQCHADITYQIVCSAVQQLVDTGEIQSKVLKEKNSNFHLSAVGIYKSFYTDLGLQGLSCLNGEELSLNETFRILYRISWLYLFSQVEEKQVSPLLTKKVFDQMVNVAAGIEHLYSLCEFGKKYSKYILQEISCDTPSIAKLKEYSSKIDEIDRLQGLVKDSYPVLSPLIDFFTVAKANLVGKNIVELTESSYLVYNDSALMCNIMYELVEKIVTEYRTKNGINTNQDLRDSN